MNIENDLHGEFDFEQHRLKAIEQYQKVHPLFEEFAYVLKNVLAEAFNANSIKIHSIEARAKAIDSFGKKVTGQSLEQPNQPKYPHPLSDITDLAGVRVITFFPITLDLVDKIIRSEFDVIEMSDKALLLIKEEKFGYSSIHYLVRLEKNRTALLEYNRFENLIGEIQVRTILQHAWAEIEHDIQYRFIDTIPSDIRRRFMSLAGMLEIADREFQAIQDEDERLRIEARQSVREGKLENVEITPDALKAYLDNKLGPDGRMTDFSYQFTAGLLRRIGFSDFREIEECIGGYDDDHLSRILWSTRQGQITRFEYQLLAGMGENYIKYHHWSKYDWFIQDRRKELDKFRQAGIEIGAYLPSAREVAEQEASADA
jgi:ppGpp synthetase/RelA/SpoT-type nucleotidyltranferase